MPTVRVAWLAKHASMTALRLLPNLYIIWKTCLERSEPAECGCLTAWRRHMKGIKDCRCFLYVQSEDNFHRAQLYHYAVNDVAASPPLSRPRTRLLVHRFQHTNYRHCALLHTQLHRVRFPFRISAISCRSHDESYRNDGIAILRV